MRCLARILLNVATGVSLLLCVATVVLWAQSYHAQYAAIWVATGGRTETWLSSAAGQLSFSRQATAGAPLADDGRQARVRVLRTPPSDMTRRLWPATLGREAGFVRAGVGFRTLVVDRPTRRSSRLMLFVPHWLVAAVSAVLPTYVSVRAWRRPRAGQCRCPACGYDLRATPGRCPECGKIRTTDDDSLARTSGVGRRGAPADDEEDR